MRLTKYSKRCNIDSPLPQHCKFKVEEKTLFFMPHCGMAMYNNLLWSNWGVEKMEMMVIIGNSFNSYYEKWGDKIPLSNWLFPDTFPGYQLNSCSKKPRMCTMYPQIRHAKSLPAEFLLDTSANSLLWQIRSACHEIALPTNYTDSTVFNDTALHLFPESLLKEIHRSVWENCPEPSLDPSDPEIIL